VVNARRVESDKRGDEAERKLQEAERRLGIKVEIHFEPNPYISSPYRRGRRTSLA
jgi:hypothetical protein